jgi:hypothetical protein
MKINFKEKKDVSFKIGVGGYLEPEKRHLLKLFFGFLDRKIQKDYKVKNIRILIRDDGPYNCGHDASVYFYNNGYVIHHYYGDEGQKAVAEEADMYVFFKDKGSAIEPPTARNLVLIEK